ncbi:MAG: GHKL domain-containing protein [Actinobacteria bacterium]|nr:GHKL domain-containing protein [Actinomycetota bacterium]
MADKPVLFAVDDDPEVLHAVERDLRRKYGRSRNGGGYRILRADSAASMDALGKLKLRRNPVALFLVDQRMLRIRAWNSWRRPALKEYSHMDKTAMREVDVREGLESTLTILAHKLKKGVSVEKEYAEGLPRICANGGELNQVWTNIVDNAVDAMHGHGSLKVKTFRDDGYVLVEISDDGSGIPREAKTRIFEPFFTTKGVGEGTGLGLDIVRRIVAGHGGEIRVDSAPGQTTFKVRLPIDGPRREPDGEADGDGG